MRHEAYHVKFRSFDGGGHVPAQGLAVRLRLPRMPRGEASEYPGTQRAQRKGA